MGLSTTELTPQGIKPVPEGGEGQNQPAESTPPQTRETTRTPTKGATDAQDVIIVRDPTDDIPDDDDDDDVDIDD